jgi:hypothetical protein
VAVKVGGIIGTANSFETSRFRDRLSGKQENRKKDIRKAGNQGAGIVDKNVNNEYRTPNIQCRSKIATALRASQ